jgi:parallel beta-helix repeat protein
MAILHVSIHAQSPGDGSPDRPFPTVQAAADRAGPGDTVLVGPGVYRERIDLRRSGTAEAPITLASAEPLGAVLCGSDVTTGWRRVEGSSNWELAWTSPLPAMAKYGVLAGRGEQVFVDGLAHRQVRHADQLVAGTFCYDGTRLLLNPGTYGGEVRSGSLTVEASGLIGGGSAEAGRDGPDAFEYILAPFDAAQHSIEVTTRVHVLTTSERIIGSDPPAPVAAHIVLRGFVIRHAGAPPQRPMVSIYGPGSVVEDCLIEWSAGRGIDIKGDGSVMRRCTVRFCGQMGLGGGMSRDVLIEDVDLIGNNTKHSSFVCMEQGGCKICRATAWTMRRVRALGNDGPGIWFDIDNRDCIIERCWCQGNSGPGIMYEISWSGTIRNNVCVANGFPHRHDVRFDSAETSVGAIEPIYGQGILVQKSQGCRVLHNTCVGNRRCGIELRHHPYGIWDPQQRSSAALGGNEVLNNLCCDNAWEQVVATPVPALPGQRELVQPNRIDHNLYFTSAALRQHRGDLAAYARWGKTMRAGEWSLEEWRAYQGCDRHSLQWEPFFVAMDRHDFRLQRHSPAIAAGAACGVCDDLFGRPRPQDRAPSIGACEYHAADDCALPWWPAPPA